MDDEHDELHCKEASGQRDQHENDMLLELTNVLTLSELLVLNDVFSITYIANRSKVVGYAI
jgi:hypothetical protein